MTWTNYKIASSNKPTRADKGKMFYCKAVADISIPSNASKVVLSSEENGQGETQVDDVIYLTLIDQSNPKHRSLYSHDYSNNCSGDVYSEPPYNLISDNHFPELLGKKVTASIEFWDKCGGLTHSTSFYICVEASA